MSLSDWVVDYAYFAKGSIAFQRKPPKHYRVARPKGKITVILLSGLTLKWTFMRYLGDAISGNGHPVFIVPALGRNFANIKNSAAFVRALIDENALEQVIIVGHSKGGIIGKYLLAYHNQDKVIKNVIAIASPFSGARLAHIIPHRSIQEMTPESQVIQELAKNKTVNSRIVSIIPAFDNHVWEGSYLEGAQNVNVTVRGHHKVVFDKEVEAVILERLALESKSVLFRK